MVVAGTVYQRAVVALQFSIKRKVNAEMRTQHAHLGLLNGDRIAHWPECVTQLQQINLLVLGVLALRDVRERDGNAPTRGRFGQTRIDPAQIPVARGTFHFYRARGRARNDRKNVIDELLPEIGGAATYIARTQQEQLVHGGGGESPHPEFSVKKECDHLTSRQYAVLPLKLGDFVLGLEVRLFQVFVAKVEPLVQRPKFLVRRLQILARGNERLLRCAHRHLEAAPVVDSQCAPLAGCIAWRTLQDQRPRVDRLQQEQAKAETPCHHDQLKMLAAVVNAGRLNAAP